MCVLVFLQSLKPLLGLRVELHLEGPSGTDPTPASSISGPCLEKPGPTDPSAASSSPAPGLLGSPSSLLWSHLTAVTWPGVLSDPSHTLSYSASPHLVPPVLPTPATWTFLTHRLCIRLTVPPGPAGRPSTRDSLSWS